MASDVAIMTDSNCGFMPREGEKMGITVIPMPILINGDVYYEGKNITTEEFYQALSRGDHVTTSQPSPGDLMDTWRALLREHREVVCIPMSSGLSSTCQSAVTLAQDEEFAGRVFVVDNHRISVTQAQSVLDAKAMAGDGMSGAAIRDRLEAEAMEATIYITVDTLEYLKKGGRITPAAAAIGTVLNLKPVLTIQGDKLDAFSKSRGFKTAFRTMVKALHRDLDIRLASQVREGTLKVGMATTLMEPEKLSMWKEELRREFQGLELFHLPLTMSIGCHTGPGALGIGAVRYYRKG
ncbi:MAG TPA: DegV family protein [Candidatus Pullilachnospira intestinigallinarum]|nr:DegV family protein [Candidatus Pullilachnospira intestinigallinarum]